MELRQAERYRVGKIRIVVSNLIEERLEKLGQTNGISRVPLVAGEEGVLESGNGVGEGDEGSEEGGDGDVFAGINHRECQYPAIRPV